MDIDKTQHEETKDWITHIADIVNKNYAERKIVLWGKYQASDDIKEKLKEKYGLDIAFYIDGDTKKIDNRQVFSTDCLEGKASEYYVVIPLAFYQSIKNKLEGGGYKSEIDYYYFSDCVVCQRDDYYEDAHGNKIIGKYQGLKFAFSGFGSTIEIGNHIQFQSTCIYIHNDSRVIIGNECCFQEADIYVYDDSQVIIGNGCCFQGTDIHVYDDSQIIIGNECNVKYYSLVTKKRADVLLNENVKICGVRFNNACWLAGEYTKLKIDSCSTFGGNGRLYLGKNGLLQVGKAFSIGKNYDIAVSSNTSILIGDDCIFSYDIFMRSSDGHSIFDVVTGENINTTYEISKSRKIDIGSHVWVGMQTTILYNTKINDGSIVGARSLVKGTVPNNCIVAGIPAKIIRKNVSWSREYCAESIEECGSQYVNVTK